MRPLRPLLILALGASSLTAPLGAADRLPVASLSSVLADLARNVGGDHVEVTEIIAPGVDPHMFEPTVSDIRRIADARVVLASGLGFEGFLDNVRESVGSGPTFIVVGDAIDPIVTETDHDHDHADHDHHHHGDGADPHWWHSIPNVEIAVTVIRDAFIAADPANTDAYQANATAYQAQLAELAREIRIMVAAVPRDDRILVTSHDALAYFARDYEFTILPVQGITTDEQPSSQRVREVIDTIRSGNVKAIFAEDIENPKILEEITRETGVTVSNEPLFADGLGEKRATTYLEMMRHNAETITSALK